MKCPSYNIFFETISPKTRLDIIQALRRKDMYVGEICSELKEEQSKISHNLKKLADCNFLNVRREGKQRIYSLNKETIVPLMNLVERHVSTFCDKRCTKSS